MSDQELETTEFEDNFEASFEEPEVEAPVEETPEVTYEYEGRTFTSEQLAPITKFATWASENPERWEKLQKWESGEIDFSEAQVVEQAIAPPEVAEEFDPFDEDYLRKLGPEIQSVRAELERRDQREASAAVDAGISAFSQTHQDLSKDDMNAVLKWVHDRGTMASVPQDLPYAEKQQAVIQRFEEGYKVLFYDRIAAEQAKQVTDDLAKRRRAAASSSSPVSSPRVRPAASSKNEAHQQFVDDIAQALSEGS